MSLPTPPTLSGASLLPRPILILPKQGFRASSRSPSVDSPGDASAPKRRCISSACMPCRKRKSKCDGGRPACDACLTIYRTSCSFDIDSDHRRKGALKRDISQLREETTTLQTIVEALKKRSESEVDDIIQLLRTHPDESYEWLADSIKNLAIVPKKPDITALQGELEEYVLQPTLDTTGEIRNYGHTSNFYTIHGPNDDLPIPAMERFDSWTNVTTDRELIKHLLSLYFAWVHPFYLLFSEEVFYHGLNAKKTKLCSPLLVNAILATACNFSDRPEARADPYDPFTVGNHFFAEAQRLLRVADRASLTTVQALGILSIRQAMIGDDNNGSLYVWQMMAMSVQLGLHLSCSPNVNGQITPTEIEARRVTFWGCHIIETSYSICVGRVSSFLRHAIQLEKPLLRENLESKIWKPHGDPRFPGGMVELEQPSYTYTLLLHHASLIEIVNDIVFWFYAPRDRRTSRKLLGFHERFKTWYRNLPDCLAMREGQPTLPQVITLHMFYHNCVLHLFRPFLLQSFVHSPSKPPRQICTETAFTISDLVAIYKQTYGLRRSYFMISHCIMTAAIIHVRNISNPNQTPLSNQDPVHVIDAINAIHEMEQTFPLVRRYLKALQGRIQAWVNPIPPPINDALLAAGLSSPSSSNTSPDNASYNSHPPNQLTHRNHSFPQSVLGLGAPSSPTLSTHSDTRTPGLDSLYHFPNTNLRIPDSRQFYWTPFPDHSEGMPLPLPSDNTMRAMDISSVLDSGENPLWAQLNRDGFTIGVEDVNVLQAGARGQQSSGV